MDWIKQMSLRKSLFTLTFISIIAAFILSVAAFWGCIRLRGIIAPEGIMIDPHTAAMTELPAPSKSALQFAGVLEALQIILPVLFFVTALILTSSLFYRMKLREPIALLTDSADRIMANDLEVSVSIFVGLKFSIIILSGRMSCLTALSSVITNIFSSSRL